MKAYIKEYINYLEKALKNNKTDFNKLKIELIDKINFFNHERIIHLIVTMFYGLFMLLMLSFGFLANPVFFIFAFMFMCFVIPYIYHYFFLENHTQYLYKIYDQINKKIDGE